MEQERSCNSCGMVLVKDTEEHVCDIGLGFSRRGKGKSVKPKPVIDVAYLIGIWDPAQRPNHCANCQHTDVHGSAEAPLVSCKKGLGKDRALHIIIRPKAPRSFVQVGKCSEFSSMDD